MLKEKKKYPDGKFSTLFPLASFIIKKLISGMLIDKKYDVGSIISSTSLVFLIFFFSFIPQVNYASFSVSGESRGKQVSSPPVLQRKWA